MESDALLKDYDTLSALLAGASDEVTNTNYARFVWTDVDLAPYTVDDTFDRITLQLPSKTGTTILAGTYWRKMIICYDPDTTAGTDTTLVPVKAFDMLNTNGTPIIPDGGNILCAWPYGFHVAQ